MVKFLSRHKKERKKAAPHNKKTWVSFLLGGIFFSQQIKKGGGRLALKWGVVPP
jgi:hypothetical protein